MVQNFSFLQSLSEISEVCAVINEVPAAGPYIHTSAPQVVPSILNHWNTMPVVINNNFKHTCIQYIHTVHTYIYTYCARSCICTYMQYNTDTYNTYIHTYIHTYIRTFIKIFMHTYIHVSIKHSIVGQSTAEHSEFQVTDKIVTVKCMYVCMYVCICLYVYRVFI